MNYNFLIVFEGYTTELPTALYKGNLFASTDFVTQKFIEDLVHQAEKDFKLKQVCITNVINLGIAIPEPEVQQEPTFEEGIGEDAAAAEYEPIPDIDDIMDAPIETVEEADIKEAKIENRVEAEEEKGDN